MKRKDKTPAPIRLMQWLFPKLERWAPPLARRMFRLVFYVPIGYAVPEKEQQVQRTARLLTITAAGKRLRGYAWGEESAPYILLIHGWAGRITQFRKFI